MHLFLAQLRGLLLALWRRFFPPRATVEEEQTVLDDRKVAPNVRTVREMYRAMLKRAAGRGYSRLRIETPYEFQQRLDGRTVSPVHILLPSPMRIPPFVTAISFLTSRSGAHTPRMGRVSTAMKRSWQINKHRQDAGS